jgi:hypothetical protein
MECANAGKVGRVSSTQTLKLGEFILRFDACCAGTTTLSSPREREGGTCGFLTGLLHLEQRGAAGVKDHGVVG